MEMKKISGHRSFFVILTGVLLLFFIVSCGTTKKSSHRAAGATHQASKTNEKHILEKYETILDTHLDPSSTELYTYIDKWMGVPYRYGGSTKSGTDCSGFAMNVYRDIYKITISHSSEKQYEECKHIKGNHLHEGDLVFFRINKEKKVSHVGIYLANNKFVHATTKKGVMIDDLSEPYYANTYVGAGKY